MAIKLLFFELYTEKSPRVLSTQAHVDRSVSIFKEPHVESQVIKFIGYSVVFGGSSDKEEENEYSLGKIKVCNIPVRAAPILLGILLSISKVAIERQDLIFDQTFFQKVSFSLSKRQLRDTVGPIWINTQNRVVFP